MKSKRTIITLISTIFVAALFYLWPTPNASTPNSTEVSGTTFKQADEISTSTLSMREHLPTASPELDHPEGAGEGHRRISGRVIMLEGTRVPEGLLVQIFCNDVREKNIPNNYQKSRGLPSSVRVQNGGDFTIEIPKQLPLGIMSQVLVVDGDTKIFDGTLRIGDGMIVLVRAPRLLHGMVKGVSRLCESVGFALGQELSLGRSNLLAKGWLDDTGKFTVISRIAIQNVPVKLNIGCGDNLYTFQTDLETLSSVEGYNVDLMVRHLAVEVRDELDRPLEGVKIGVGTETMHSSNNGVITRAHTDAIGQAVMSIKAGVAAEIFVGIEGMTQIVRAIPAGIGPVRELVKLRKLSTEDTIEGQVLDGFGMPVEEAIVTARPVVAIRGLNLVLRAQTRTNEEGEFKLDMGGEGLKFSIKAFKKTHGISRTYYTSAPAKNVVIEIKGCQVLAIDGVAPNWVNTAEGGDVEWFLVSHSGGLRKGGAGSLPVTTEPVAIGDYLLMMFAPTLGLFAREDLQIGCESNVRKVSLMFEEARWFNGEIKNVDGRKLYIEHVHPDWIGAMRDTWGRVPCMKDGSFKVLAGLKNQGKLKVSDESGAILAVVQAKVGDAAHIVLER